MHEKISSTASFLGSHNVLPDFAAVLLSFADVFPSAPDLPPTAALKMKEALSTNILVTSSADFVCVAFAKSVI